MKILIIVFLLSPMCALSQKTQRLTVSKIKEATVIGSVTKYDTIFMLMGQNARYTHIIDIVSLKAGTLQDINDLLTECLKFIGEANGNSLTYKGNRIVSVGSNRLMVSEDGESGYILLHKQAIIKLQNDIAAFH
jgi:hypothetical protein